LRAEAPRREPAPHGNDHPRVDRIRAGRRRLRIDDDTLLISASGSTLGCLVADDLATVRISDGARLLGPKPSMETELHRRIYRARPEVRAILHGQSRAATLADVLRRGAFFELACVIATSGHATRVIPPEDAAQLRTYARG
jgi:ribulose-5-phosphate 4-epimerase/fuculose-1-phosphate aldolase